MNFSLSVYDVLSNAIPGSMQLACLFYVAWRTDVLDWSSVSGAASITLLFFGIGASIVAGHLTYIQARPLGHLAVKATGDRFNEISEFQRRNEVDGKRPFVGADTNALLAAIQVYDRDLSAGIIRLRAESFMLTNSAVPLAIGGLIALGEVVGSENDLLAFSLAILLFAASAAALYDGARLSYWARMKTLEIAAWIPGVDSHWS